MKPFFYFILIIASASFSHARNSKFSCIKRTKAFEIAQDSASIYGVFPENVTEVLGTVEAHPNGGFKFTLDQNVTSGFEIGIIVGCDEKIISYYCSSSGDNCTYIIEDSKTKISY